MVTLFFTFHVQQKRLKLQNQVIAELVEALRSIHAIALTALFRYAYQHIRGESTHHHTTCLHCWECRMDTHLQKCSKCSGAKKQIEELILFGTQRKSNITIWMCGFSRRQTLWRLKTQTTIHPFCDRRLRLLFSLRADPRDSCSGLFGIEVSSQNNR